MGRSSRRMLIIYGKFAMIHSCSSVKGISKVPRIVTAVDVGADALKWSLPLTCQYCCGDNAWQRSMYGSPCLKHTQRDNSFGWIPSPMTRTCSIAYDAFVCSIWYENPALIDAVVTNFASFANITVLVSLISIPCVLRILLPRKCSETDIQTGTVLLCKYYWLHTNIWKSYSDTATRIKRQNS